MSEPATATKPTTKSPGSRSAKKTHSMTKVSMAASEAVMQMLGESVDVDPADLNAATSEPMTDAERASYHAMHRLLNAFANRPVEPKAELAARMAAKKPIPTETRFWEDKFTSASTSYDACATKLKGARRDLWRWLASVKALLETHDDPATPGVVKDALEVATKYRLKQIGMLPKTPKVRSLILPAALFPEVGMSDRQKLSLQKQMSVYRAVLRVAEEEGVSSADLAAWIEERNGIERIRLRKEKDKGTDPAPSAVALQEQAAINKFAAAVRSGPPRLSLNDVQPSDIEWNPDKDHPEIILLATYHPSTKTIAVKEVVKHAAAFAAVIRIASKKSSAPATAPAGSDEDEVL